MNVLRICLVISCLSMGGRAAAQDSGETVTFVMPSQVLRQACAEPQTSANYKAQNRVCSGYIIGVLDGLTTASVWQDSKSLVCLPQGVTGQAVIEGVKKSIAKLPVEKEETAAALVLVSLIGEFPCRAK